ncbi:VOC family protein [Cryobacterium sp. PH31-L1]|uniref:VOC family protein n=1 Tax=Cryobacterium sp. PH31-L1 TaxID=3046199 RepID=UPI0024BB1F88|nr:VOC family protein [Cryobacterium sp. PH31-L1]MDJ0377068.1 VOC family protein [Cryobacterium sp. PH31-L1]
MAFGVHHIEIWVADLDSARRHWSWLLVRLGWSVDQEWNGGMSWTCGDAYLVITRPPALSGDAHDRRLPGINHVARHGGSAADVDRIVGEAIGHGWSSLDADRYPHAGGPDHYAAYLENEAGFKVEVVGAS